MTLTSTSVGSRVGTGTFRTDASWVMVNLVANRHAAPSRDLSWMAKAFMTAPGSGVDIACDRQTMIVSSE